MAKMEKPDIYQVETNILPHGKLIVVFFALAFAMFVSFVDQNSIGVALPTIGQDLDCTNTIAWAGTSSLIANTMFQVLYGRLSDIFGRKVIFLSSVGVLSLGDLLCSFAKTGSQLYAFRGISGVGQGGIIALAMMIVSDVVTLKDRGKYQGILGGCIGLGNAVGPFLAAAFIKCATWRALFWFICPLGFLSGVLVMFILPPSKVSGDPKAKAAAIDYYGILFSSAAVLLLLIPISGGGTYFTWKSPMAISMLVLGSICMVVFIIIEWRYALFPMIQLRLFRIPAVFAILAQNFLFGIVYYSHLYYLPIYYQNARQYSPLKSAALTIPFVGAQSIISIFSGQYINRMNRYGELIRTGFFFWALGTGLILLWNLQTSNWKIIVILMVEGAGVGNVFQPTLIAAQAHTQKSDRAIVISIRNFLRSLGGAIGLALSSALYSNVLAKSVARFSDGIPEDFKALVLKSSLRVPKMTLLTASQKREVLNAYMASSRAVFILWLPLMTICLLLCLFIKDRGLARPEESSQDEGIASGMQKGIRSKSSLELV